MRAPGRPIRRTLAVCILAGLLAGSVGAVEAAFFSSTSNPPGSFTSKLIFPRDTHLSAWNLRDASGGTEADQSDVLSYDDARVATVGNWANSEQVSRYLDLDFNSPLPPGLPLDSATLRFEVAGNQGSGNACYFLEARSASTGTVFATYGSAGSPLACSVNTNYVLTLTDLTGLTTTDQVNDLRLRFRGWHTGGKAWLIDEAIVRTYVLGVPYTLHPKTMRDASTGTLATTPWAVATGGDGAGYASASTWTTAFTTARYLRLTFPRAMPTGAEIESVTLEHAYRSQTNGDTTCWYADVLQGTTPIATYGSSGSPLGCNATASFTTDAVALADVDTPAELNDLVVKLYVRNSGTRRSEHDLVRLVVRYGLDQGSGCVNPGDLTLYAFADGWIDQNKPNDNHAAATTMEVETNSTKNRRAHVNFALPPTPAGCVIEAAALRMYLDSKTGGARTLNAYRLAAAWGETTITWTNQPGVTGSLASATAPAAGTWMQWDVETLVEEMYASANNGFQIRDAAEGGAGVTEIFQTRENTNTPQLVLTFGEPGS